MADMNSFFFWATWACATNRPNSDITYTKKTLELSQTTIGAIRRNIWRGAAVTR